MINEISRATKKSNASSSTKSEYFSDINIMYIHGI